MIKKSWFVNLLAAAIILLGYWFSRDNRWGFIIFLIAGYGLQNWALRHSDTRFSWRNFGEQVLVVIRAALVGELIFY
ncbi:hypothetical protein HU830_02260 [Lactobacillus sp. DCY120]|uniref:Uncharacterized protein n=1 Tax=Bombilactobacillus apium TaxID=2675299 RepID=A0A850QZ94_9LACO|nr:hypothetical protein [Bombilactobacillus apium]NVY96013.1 hypothetical protein [Bombilactobacillus apium]